MDEIEDEFRYPIDQDCIYEYQCSECDTVILQHLTDGYWKGGIICAKCNCRMDIIED